ncbi:MAG TPA: SH3 domain-containing protein [Sphingomonas sp.]|nr:SH3 domain-containing protein [Sphingomonas sp.]
MVLALAAPAWAQRKPPYFVSIKAGKALMRAGPGRNYPANWLYKRRGLPLKVVDVYGEWRKVEDPGGTQGWMLSNLLDEQRTAYVMGSIAELRATPDPGARVNWRAAPGVIGTISKCESGWCWLQVGNRGGYVEQAHLWGTEPGEVVD